MAKKRRKSAKPAQCKAKTSAGKRCRLPARSRGFCQVHVPRPKDPAKGGRKLCQGFTSAGTPCQNKAIAGGYCGRHRDQLDDPESWQAFSKEEIERRKQFALMRKRELEIAETEGRLVDASIARTESTRIATQIQNQIGSMAARRSHEIAAKLGVTPGAVAAALEAALRAELKEIAESL